MNEHHTTPLELLAPAGNADIGIVAVDHGADAVYIGAPRFSARANAASSMDGIRRLIDHAHLFNARVYMALNTLLNDTEIKDALAIIREAHDAGIDGLIFQDMGLLELDLPPVPLIASTQTHNATAEKVKFLEDLGVSRVILARELSLNEIRDIRRKTTVELESFVHGALCVSYSGQCYMSQAAFGRSGNRGVCAQPCRLPSTLLDGKGKKVIADRHLLSLKDLNLVDHLGDLAEAGITSFKIEGRYKDAAYVKNVTAAYRKALDRIIDSGDLYRRQSSGRVAFTFEPDLDRTFNRGYTRYFLTSPDMPGHQAAMDSPKSMGAAIGTVLQTGKDSFRLSGGPVHNGDGLCFVGSNGTLKGFRADRVENGRIFPNDMTGISTGLRLFRNRDHEFLKQLDRKTADRRIAVTMVFHQTVSDIRLTVTDEDGHSVTACQPVVFEESRNPEKMKAQIHAQLSSTGTTCFHMTDLKIETPSPGFLSLGLLNGLRREALTELTRQRKETHVPKEPGKAADPAPVCPEITLDYRANVLNRFARAFYKKHGAEDVADAFETGPARPGDVLMTTRYCIRRELGACLKQRDSRLKLTPPLTLVQGKRSYGLRFDCDLCRMHVVVE